MIQTIEKHSIKIQLLTLLTMLITVISWTYIYAMWQAQAKEERNINAQKIKTLQEETWLIKNQNFSTRLWILETKIKTQQEYLYNMKFDLKRDIEKNNDKVNQIYNLIIKM